MSPVGDYEKTYDDFWKELVETDGQMDPDKVKRELHDYWMCLQEVPKVYDHVTCGVFSKPNTIAEFVIEATERFYAGARE